MGTLFPFPGRLDRHIRRGKIRVGQRISRQHAAFSLEEALRLAELAGEQEGRVYYFRRVALAPIRQGLNRREWLARVQETLESVAATAVPGEHPRAGSANAVYFDNTEQALETLLRAALAPVNEIPWFVFSGLDVPAGTSAAEITRRVAERLCHPDMPLPLAASIALSALGSADPERLLTPLPVERVRSWLRAWDKHDTDADVSEPPATPLSPRLTQCLSHAARRFGSQEPRTVWLATLVAAFLMPSAARSAAPVSRARSMLKSLEDVARPQPAAEAASLGARPTGTTTGTDSSVAAPPAPDPPRGKSSVNQSVGMESVGVQRPEGSTEPSGKPEWISATGPLGPNHTHLLGEPTAAAGLYFLLNALRYLGINAALEANPALGKTHLIDHVLRRLATHAQVDPTDPILLALSPASPFPASPLVRTWAVAVRRWCWHQARITTREIIRRPGHVWLTRMDLDVTMGFSAVDVRIRKVGLDIDPGPVSALGDFGRTVRFHYREQERP
jgi:hypothetical protein